MIAGGALTGILIAILVGTIVGTNDEGVEISIAQMLNTGVSEGLGGLGDIISLLLFFVLAFILYRFAMSKQEKI